MRYQVGSLKRLLLERLEKSVQKTETCWLWTGAKTPLGYGKISVFGKPRGAHVVSWIIHRGYIPEGLFVLHHCDIPGCVNPDHLFLGTHTDNMRDMHAKGRGDNRRGENSARTHFSESQVLDIYRRAWAGERCIDLSREYGVLPTTISCIKHGDNWSYLTGHARKNGVTLHDASQADAQVKAA